MDRDPYFGSTGKHGHSGHKCRQAFFRAKVDILAGPWVMAKDQARCLSGNVDGLQQQSAAGGREVLCLGSVEMNGLWVRLRGRSGAVGDIDPDTQQTHDVHSNEYRGRFEADDHNKAGSPSSSAPL